MKRDYTLTAVSRALDILEFLGQHERGCEARALSESLHIPKSTLFRYLVNLEGRGYVRRNRENGKYGLGLKILELCSRTLTQMTIHEVALPYMRDLLDRFQETVNLGVLEENEVVYVEILESPQAFKMSSHVGGRDFPHATSIGKAMLAFLPEEEVERIVHATGLPRHTEKTITSLSRLKEELTTIRQRGYAIDDQENEEGACCIGAPIFDRRGDVIAAISISGPARRFSTKEIEDMGTALLEATSQISQNIGHLSER